jgi:hypothetical protein
LHETYQEAATHLGLFADDNEASYELQEAVHSLRTPQQVRVLFVHLLVNDCVPTPLHIWEEFSLHFARDFILQNENIVNISTNLALHEPSKYLEEYSKTLLDYGLPQPVSHLREVEHELLRWGSDPHDLSARADYLIQRLATEQRVIYDEILLSITNEQPLLMFVDEKAGRGKTFMINAICNKVHALGKIVLPTATAAFVTQLYPGGRTTHSAFKVKVIGLSWNLAMLTFCIEVPVNDKNEMLRSPITYDDARGELI